MDDNNEQECRVCRCGSEDGRPLYQPCLCSGSIALVHQDCLEQWLKHSNKDKCELCGTKYVFVPEYAEGTPDTVPFVLVAKAFVKIILLRILPSVLKIAMAVFLWLFFVPLWTSWVYRIYFREQTYKDVIVARSSFTTLQNDVVSGLVIIGVILLSSIILMSFADFVRLFWGGERPMNARRRNGPIPGPPPAAPVPIPAPAPAPAAVLPQVAPIVANHVAQVNSGDAQRTLNDETIGQIAPDTSGLFARANNDENLDNLSQQYNSHVFRSSLEMYHRLDNDGPLGPSNSTADGILLKALNSSVNSPMKRSNMNDQNDPERTENTQSNNYLSALEVDDWLLFEGDAMSTDISPHHPNSSDETGHRVPIVSTPPYESLGLRRRKVPFPENESHINPDQPVGDVQDPSTIKEETIKEEAVHPLEDIPQDEERLSEASIDWEDPVEDGNDWHDEVEENIAADPVAADVEVRFALDELLGLRGPPSNIVKHVIWFLTFTGLYLFVFVFFPVSMGSIIVEVLYKHFPWLNQLINIILPAPFHDIVIKAQALAEEKKLALCLSDLTLTVVGYFTIYAITASWHLIMSFIRSTMINSLEIYVKFLDNLVVAGKIGALLSVRIFLLPLSLGTMILTCFNVILQYKSEAITVYLAENLVGCLTLAWTIGISYMLIITLSVLQLREILHPDILAKSIRPQETHSELLESLVHEAGLTHFRRLVVSLMVYLILLIVLLFIPLMISKFIVVYIFNIAKSDIRVWYYIPELQLPLEVAMGHFTMLTVLEGKKNYIGKFLFHWILFISKKFKAVRFVLPCPMKRAFIPGQRAIGMTSDAMMRPMRDANQANRPNLENMSHGLQATSNRGAVLLDVDGNPRVGRPLRRPPVGWDARNHDHQPYDNKVTTRWAWGSEELSDVESNVAPRLIPSDWLVKSAILIGSSWLMIACLVIFAVIVPISIGRWIFYQLNLPLALHHDPIACFIGILVCYHTARGISKLRSSWTRFVNAFSMLPTEFYVKGLYMILAWNASIFMGNCLLLLSSDIKDIPDLSSITVSSVLHVWTSNQVIIYTIAAFSISGGAEYFFNKIGYPDAFGIARKCRVMKAAILELCDSVYNGQDAAICLRNLTTIGDHLIYPTFKEISFSFFISSAVAFCIFLLCWISSTGTAKALQLCNKFVIVYIFKHIIFPVFKELFTNLCNWLNQAIKDENYLAGRRLQNVEMNQVQH